MKATALGIWYRQNPYGFIVNPQGEVVEPKKHNGSVFVWHERKRKPVSKIPKLSYQDVDNFKTVFL